MDIQVLGAWGELLGGVAGIVAAAGVIATLLYLARQVQQNTKSVQSSAYAACMAGNAAVHESHMAAVDILPEYFSGRAKDWDLLESVEYTRFHGHATQVFMQFELVFLMHKDGVVDREFFEARMGLLKRALEIPGNLRWWKEWAHHFYDRRFRDYTEEIIGSLD